MIAKEAYTGLFSKPIFEITTYILRCLPQGTGHRLALRVHVQRKHFCNEIRHALENQGLLDGVAFSLAVARSSSMLTQRFSEAKEEDGCS